MTEEEILKRAAELGKELDDLLSQRTKLEQLENDVERRLAELHLELAVSKQLDKLDFDIDK